MNYDPIFHADVLTALGVDPNQLSNAHIYGRVKTILDYFKDKPNPRSEILRVISKKNGNPVDVMWTYVQLKQEKQKQLAKLNPEDFEPDVAEEIVAGHITIAKKQRIREDIKKHKAEAQKQKQLETKQNQQVSKALNNEKLDVYSQVLDEIDSYDKELDFY